MSMSVPAAHKAEDDLALPGEEDFVCNSSESPLAAIEKCLDNGIGACLVVDGRRYLGRVSLDELGHAALAGAMLAPTLGQHLRELGRHRSNAAPPDMSHREFRAVLDAFLSSWISSKGPYVEKFEEGFARFAGARHGIAVSNGTVALHLAQVALGIGPGDEVIVPDLTFAATINAVLYCGATPVIVDVDQCTWCLSLATVEAACTSRTRAIIPVHLYGRPAEMGPICAFAARRGIAVVEDCAEAPGARYAGRPVGAFGDVSCFSFYANKIITTGEGGMCVTSSP